MKRDLIVIDFDKTILPYDSFRLLILQLFWQKPFALGRLIMLRKFRIINAFQFKRDAIGLIQKLPVYPNVLERFSSKLMQDIDRVLLTRIQQMSFNAPVFVLLSASPHFYISKIGKALNMEAQGSFFDEEGSFTHLYGEEKVRFILRNYPGECYSYKFAITDHISDMPLLSLFENSEIVK